MAAGSRRISESVHRAARMGGVGPVRRCRSCGRTLYGRGNVCRCRRCPEYSHVWAGDQRQKLFRNLEVLPGDILLSAVTAPGADCLPWDERVCAGLGEHKHSGQLGHTDGGALVMSTYGHPSEQAARERLKRAYATNVRRLSPVPDESGEMA